jgi:hypothetical protein
MVIRQTGYKLSRARADTRLNYILFALQNSRPGCGNRPKAV